MCFKNLEGKSERKSPKKTIFVSGGLGLLQMVSESDIRRCVNEETESEGGWTRGGVPARTFGPEGRWIVRSHIGWGGEQSILYKSVKTSP